MSCNKKIAEKDYDIYENNINNEDILASGFLTAPLAVNGKCPEDKPILYSGKCFSCYETDELYVEKSECDKCSNREYHINSHWRVNTCELRCPKDKPLQRWDGKCFSCDELKAIQLPTHCNLEQDCEDWCPNRTILYDLGGNVPSTISCPKDKLLMSSSGICYSCDTPVAVRVFYNERLCEQACPTTRHLDGSTCKKNSTTNSKK